MTAYALALISIHDRDRYDRYAARFLEVLAGHNGRVLVADESPDVREGTWDYDKVVLVAFPTPGDLERWARSPEYTQIAKDRIAATTGCVLVLSGFPPTKGMSLPD